MTSKTKARTREDEWELSVTLNAMVCEASHTLMWLASDPKEHGDYNRTLNIRVGLEKLNMLIRKYKASLKHERLS